jgi:hypothetical protein
MFYQRIALTLIIALSVIIPAKANGLSCGDIITKALHSPKTYTAKTPGML